MKKLVATLGMVLVLSLGFFGLTSSIGQTKAHAAGTAQDIVNTAKAQIGKPYKWGASGPSSFDCSGLVHYVFSVKNGYGSLLGSRTTAQGYWNKNIHRIYSNPIAGDLVFFHHSGSTSVTHVGIMINSTQFVEAPRPGTNVKIMNLKGYSLPVTGFERIVSSGGSGGSGSSGSGGSGGVVPNTDPIKIVQMWLNKTYQSGLAINGSGGPVTKKAIVKGVQTELNKKYGAHLLIDGDFAALSKAQWRTVQYGASGNMVYLIQSRLICMGIPETDGLSGYYGTGTRNAVKKYQQMKGLVQDGVVGPTTANSMFAW
uniref:NlpC/P60 family protein n=1 Tax=Listeria TaxID=1637 RepID=UPI001D118E55|nr:MULTISPECIES: NlpC/P60 family protein [Listeria]UCK61645.1 cell wall-associated hydrolase [Listeria ivanovii]UCK61769.1 cell wall-associated hydrolase [Listeria seeligeri]UCK61909.1 cell wall-associated hydrolase [Listeria seeligeri]